MSRIEGPQVMAAILTLAVIALVTILLAPNVVEKIVVPAITAIGMLGMKLLEKNGDTN